MNPKLVYTQMIAEELYRDFNLWDSAICLDSIEAQKYTLIYKKYKQNIPPVTYLPFRYHFYKIILI